MDLVWNKQSCTIRITDELLFDKLHRKVNHLYGPGIDSTGRKNRGVIYKSDGVGMATITFYETTSNIHVQGNGYIYWVDQVLPSLIQDKSDLTQSSVAEPLSTAAIDLKEEGTSAVDFSPAEPTSTAEINVDDDSITQPSSAEPTPSASIDLRTDSAADSLDVAGDSSSPPETSSKSTADVATPAPDAEHNLQVSELQTEVKVLNKFIDKLLAHNEKLNNCLAEKDVSIAFLQSRVVDNDRIEFIADCDKKLLEKQIQTLESKLHSKSTTNTMCKSTTIFTATPDYNWSQAVPDVTSDEQKLKPQLISSSSQTTPTAQTTNDDTRSTNQIVYNVPTRNKFSELAIEASTDESSANPEDNGYSWKDVKSPKVRREKKSRKLSKDTKNIVIVGDSIVRHMDKACNQEGDVVRLCYPGSKIEHITERVQNIVSGEGNNPVILTHVGTNNLSKDTSNTMIKKYEGMIDKFRSYCPQAHIVVSGILDRRDNKELRRGVPRVNKKLQDLCQRKGVEFLDHSLLTHREGWLSKDKLHLNRRGNMLLGDSFRRSIREGLNK